jgi:GlcNAc-PI de-N-acetylase
MPSINRISIYAAAHQDDWQLFMNPEVSRDLGDAGCRTVIIHTTAGDGGKSSDYWEAREKAAIDSVIFRLSTGDAVCRYGEVELPGDRKIARAEINNCALYFLRLPDGAYYGEGFGTYDHQSLEKFRQGHLQHLRSVDGLNEYGSWMELSTAIDALIDAEFEAIPSILRDGTHWISFPEPDASLNPDDHNDHFNTALLMQSTDIYRQNRKRAFVHYHIRDYPNFLSGPDLFWKAGMFSIYHQTLYQEYGHSTLSEDPSFIPWSLLSSISREIGS